MRYYPAVSVDRADPGSIVDEPRKRYVEGRNRVTEDRTHGSVDRKFPEQGELLRESADWGLLRARRGGADGA